jgi:hypothetical protein
MHKLKKMKQILISSTLAIVTLISASTVKAQDVAGVFIKSKITHVIDPSTKEVSKVIPLDQVNVHAARDFSKKYNGAQEITWVDGATGPSVYFKYNGVKMRSTYDRTGKREYTLRYFDDATMPKELRHLVKSTYYDYTIDNVTEVQRKEYVSYLVKMQNEKEFLTLKVIEGEMYPFEKIEKSK